MSLGDKIERL